MEYPKTTPMMDQWISCKKKAKDALLLFRLGDFYEAFYEDAHVIAKDLNLTLTKRQQIPMCGVPFHTCDGYIDKLVAKGHKVAIAEQMSDPRETKGIVDRQITRILLSLILICFQKKTIIFSSLWTRLEKLLAYALLIYRHLSVD